jgi:hypothetical protein
MSSQNKKHAFHKTQKHSSLKDINNAYYLRCIKKQLFQKPVPSSLTKTPTKPPQTTSNRTYQTLTSAKSKSPKQFIKLKTPNAMINIHSHNISHLNESNEANNSLNDYMEQHNQSKLITNKTIEYNSNTNTKRTKHISFTPSTTPVAGKTYRSKSKKDILSSNNNINHSNKGNNVIGRNGNVDVDGVFNAGKRRADTGRTRKGKMMMCYKKNFSSNDVTVYCNEEKDCKVLRHKAAVLRFQVERIKMEKMKIEEMIKQHNENKEIIKKLLSEIQSYNNVATSCKRNCHELTKEIISLQTQIKQYK